MNRSLTARLASMALAGCALLGQAGNVAQAADPSTQPSEAVVHAHHARVKTGSRTVTAAADLTAAQVVARINADRARYGVAALTLDTSVTAALNAHAHYITLNRDVDDDITTEESTRSGYTTAGADIAPYTSAQTASSWSSAIEAWLSDPWYRDVELLDPTVTSIGLGLDGTTLVYSVQGTGNTPTGYPRTYPRGANVTELANQATWLASDYGCTAAGFPITAMWDYTTYGQASTVSGSLAADGTTVASCVASTSMLSFAQAALVPTAALKPGTHYTGTIQATLPVLAGGSQHGSQAIDFTTAAPATGIAGDQTGDRMADLFAADTSGNLWLYKGTASGGYGHGWKVGHGWGGVNWLAVAGDIDKDGRSDLIARSDDGRLWLFYSQGMGQFRMPMEVGHGWGGLSVLTVVGDMNHDGGRDLVGRTSDGRLLRYDLGTTVTGGTAIGTGWGGMQYLIGPGSVNGDAYDDIVAVRNDGSLFAYYSGPTGTLVSSKQVGHGWSGWTGLFVPGDQNGDGRLDMTGRNASGELYTYQNDGAGGWRPAVEAGRGFGGFRLLA